MDCYIKKSANSGVDHIIDGANNVTKSPIWVDKSEIMAH